MPACAVPWPLMKACVVISSPLEALPQVPRGNGQGLATEAAMFLFFSNRVGCFGSVILSVVLTVVLIMLMRSCNSGSGSVFQ